MCTIEKFDALYPDGRRIPTERLVPCPRGTRTRPCNNAEVRPIFDNHLATPDDLTFSIEPPRHANTPAGSGGSRVADGLAISFKLWNPFRSKKSKSKKYLVRPKTRPREDRPVIVQPLPRAPTPPMMPLRGRPPVIVPISPHRGRQPSPPRPRSRSRALSYERKRRPRRQRNEDYAPIVIIQPSSSEEDRTPSPPFTLRDHQRKSRSLSPRSRYEAEKNLIRERERRQRNTRQEQEARERAAKLAELERREIHRQAQERIEYEERRRIESAERTRRRQQQEEFQRGQAMRRQQLEDIERLNAAERAQRRQVEVDRRRREEHDRHRMEEEDRLRRARQAHIPRRPRHQAAVHHERNSMEDRGERFLREAIRRENLQHFDRHARPDATWPRGTHEDPRIIRRNTFNGRRGWRYEGQRERRDRRSD